MRKLTIRKWFKNTVSIVENIQMMHCSNSNLQYHLQKRPNAWQDTCLFRLPPRINKQHDEAHVVPFPGILRNRSPEPRFYVKRHPVFRGWRRGGVRTVLLTDRETGEVQYSIVCSYK